MSQSSSDRNLLFGILALQMDFISRDALIEAMNAWVLDKSKALGDILQEQGALAEDAHQLLEAMVCKHLEMHNNDPQQSLAALSSANAVRQAMNTLDDAHLQQSRAHVGSANGVDMGTTRDFEHRPGSELRFQILRPHARGGLGEVFVAYDAELQREVALKEIQMQHVDKSMARSRFLLEAEVTGRLEHPGIVPVYSLGTYEDGRPFYAMRFIRGDSLKDAIRNYH